MKLNFALLFASLATLAGCSDDATVSSEPASHEADVTTVELSPNVQQTISNCWDMATTAWIESLSRRPEGAPGVDLSEAYVSYMYWYTQISEPTFTGHVNDLGNWGVGAELLARYGWMSEQEFLGQAEPAAMATRHAAALNAVRWEIRGGELQRPDQRNPANIIKVLNRAWGVPSDVASDLERTFGASYKTTLRDPSTSTAGTHLHRLSEITIGFGADGATITAADAVGEPVTNPFGNDRKGLYAFSAVAPPADDLQLRSYFARAQLAMLQDLSLPVGMWYDQTRVDATGTFQSPPPGTTMTQASAHMMLFFDMTVDAPGFGLLPAGVPEYRPDARNAALADNAIVHSFRARNSGWGDYTTPGATIPFAGGQPGLNDFTVPYMVQRMNGPSGRALWFIVMPNEPNVRFEKTAL